MLEEVTAQRTGILGIFLIERTQLNAAHAQLFEKLRPNAFPKTCQFLTIQSLEFEKFGKKIVQKPGECSIAKNRNF